MIFCNINRDAESQAKQTELQMGAMNLCQSDHFSMEGSWSDLEGPARPPRLRTSALVHRRASAGQNGAPREIQSTLLSLRLKMGAMRKLWGRDFLQFCFGRLGGTLWRTPLVVTV